MRSTMTAYSHGSFMRVPPSLTNSAVTPAWRRLTSSINFGGNDHSRPTMRPIFRVMPCALGLVQDGSVFQFPHQLTYMPLDQTQRGRRVQFVEVGNAPELDPPEP